jgi:hypothetical protein
VLVMSWADRCRVASHVGMEQPKETQVLFSICSSAADFFVGEGSDGPFQRLHAFIELDAQHKSRLV